MEVTQNETDRLPLKVGLIGCGRIGTYTRPEIRKSVPSGWLPHSHAEAINTNDRLRLVSLCDTYEPNLSKASDMYNIQSSFDNYQNLILDTAPDIISVATRTSNRCEIIQFAAANGVKGIHLEKPISTNMYDCKATLVTVEMNNVALTYGTTRRFMDIFKKAKEIVCSGDIGDIVEITVEFGESMLMWDHPHSVDLLIFISNSYKVDSVQGTCRDTNSTFKGNLQDDDPIVEKAHIKFEDCVTGIIESRPGKNLRVQGTHGTVTVLNNGSNLIVHNKNGEKTIDLSDIDISPSMSGRERAFHELEQAIYNNTPKITSIQPNEIELNQNILLGIVLSSLNGGFPVALSDVDDKFAVSGKFGHLYA